MASTDNMANGDAGTPSKSQRGFVEEVILKRLKALTKKIIRIRGYGDQPSQTLNNDQRAAMASLPTLEAVARELEDLIKPGGPVETAELSQAGILRETRESASTKAVAIAQAQLEAYSETVSKRLSQFLRLHSLLHPAQATDDTHLVNGDLDLPSHLRGYVTPSDILRVGRIYEDIRAGGDVGKKALQQLSGDADTLDSEDAHILELLDLIDRPQPHISVPPSEAEVGAGMEPQFGSTNEVEEVETDAQNQRLTAGEEDDLPLGASASQLNGTNEVASAAASASASAAPPPLNFLQEDELVEKAAEVIKEPITEPQAQPTVVAEPSTTSVVEDESEDARPQAAASPKIDWAADDDDDQTPIFGASASTRATSSVQVNATPPVDLDLNQAADDDIPELEPKTQSAASLPAKPTPRASGSGSGSKRGKGRGTKSQTQTRTQSRPPLPQQQQSGSKKVVVDDDGFEQVVKKTQTQQGGGVVPQQQGRGGGAARGRGRGNGNANRGDRGRGKGLPAKPTATAAAANGSAGGGRKAKQADKPLFKSDVVAGPKA